MSRKISIILSILPLVFLSLIVFHFSLDLPYWDQWEFVPLLQKSYQGNLTFNDFWLPHNEHRPVFPRLIMLGLARLTNWNIRWELATNILLAIGIYFVILRAVKLVQFVQLDKSRTPIFLSIIVFSLTQWENWVWGWQMQIFLNVFAVCLGFYFLTKSNGNKINFIISIICGIVATFSFGNGLLFWPIGFIYLYLQTRFGIHSQARLRWETIVWLVISILIYAIYLPGLPNQFDLLSIISNLLLYLSYVTAYLGAPVFGLQPVIASLFGIIGILIFVIVIAHTRSVKNKSFFLSLGLYAILSALFTGLGRYNLGGLQAISSRYITFGNLLWLANIIFLYKAKSNRTRGIALLIIFLITATSLYRIKTINKRYNDLLTAQTELSTGTNDKLPEKLYYNGQVVKERSGFLRSFNLSLFRK